MSHYKLTKSKHQTSQKISCFSSIIVIISFSINEGRRIKQINKQPIKPNKKTAKQKAQKYLNLSAFSIIIFIFFDKLLKCTLTILAKTHVIIMRQLNDKVKHQILIQLI
ncbi:hypothetical protein ABPG73_007658 [Tetrahymena malaccensis]